MGLRCETPISFLIFPMGAFAECFSAHLELSMKESLAAHTLV